MNWLIASILIFLITTTLPLMNFLAFLSGPLHRLCLDSAPASAWKIQYQSLVCGAPLPTGVFKEGLKVTGLLHLMIVSGSHLLFVEALIRPLISKLPASRFFLFLLLGCYTLMTQGQPPVMRSFIALILQDFKERNHLQWKPYHAVLISGLLTLLIFPQWVLSYSLVLSWSAALALTFASTISGAFWAYIVLLPILLPLCPPHPLSILINILMTPILSVTLFPLSCLSFLIPVTATLTDILWSGFNRFLSATRNELNPLPYSFPLPMVFLWGYLMMIHISLHWRVLLIKRYSKNES